MSGALCVLMASAAAPSVTFSITAGVTGVEKGYSSDGVVFGTLNSSNGLKAGVTLAQVFDQNSTTGAQFEVTGLASNPLQGSLVSIACNGHTFLGSAATYTWTASGGKATWQWPLASVFGFASGNTYTGSVVKSTTVW